MAARLRRATPRRGAAAVALLLAVVGLHAWLTREVAERMDAGLGRAAPMPPRMTVAYVRELQLAAPPAAPPVLRAARAAPLRKRAPAPAAPAASAPAETAPEPPAADAAAPAPALAAASAAEAIADAAGDVAPAAPEGAASAPVADGPAFDWPPSTRVAYHLTGSYRGAVEGDAQVEWIRAGARYQVHVDLSIGPRVAPLAARRMSSEGELVGTELRPSRYDEETTALLRAPRRVGVTFGPDEIVLATGERKERVAGVQDAASQFIQMAVLFAVRPELLQVGGVVETLLALPRSLDVWMYDVLGEETLATPFGPVDAFHLKPRRTSRKPSELVAEIWFAPRLRYLPVRIRIEQDADTYIDLLIARKPELGTP